MQGMVTDLTDSSDRKSMPEPVVQFQSDSDFPITVNCVAINGTKMRSLFSSDEGRVARNEFDCSVLRYRLMHPMRLGLEITIILEI